MLKLLTEILNSLWLIDERRAHNYAPLLLSLKNGIPLSEDFSEARKLNNPYILSAKDNYNVYRDFDSQDIPEGSTAVIPIRGEIMKYSQWCGPKGTMRIAEEIRKADANPKIGSIILDIDSPGGQVDYTDIAAQTIIDTTTPVIAFINGLAASAAYWIASGADKIIANSDIAEIGSIGTMVHFADLQPMYEEMGVKFHEFYATKSTEKNKDIKEIREGNYKNYTKEVLDVINEKFIGAVKSSRPNVKEDALKGKVFFAPKAIEMGLIDEIGSFEHALNVASEMGKTSANIQKPHTMKNFTSINKILSVEKLETDDKGNVVLTAEQAEMLNAKFVEIEESRQADEQMVASLSEESARMKEENVNLNSGIAALQQSNDELTARITELENEDGAAEAGVSKSKDEFSGKDSTDEFAHNREADKFL